MAHILEINNSFEPLKDLYREEIKGGITVFEWLQKRWGKNFVTFEKPTICIINAEPVSQKTFKERVIEDEDVVNFVSFVGEPVTIFYWFVAIVSIASIAIALSMPKPTVPGERADPDPVYDLKGQRNQNRLGHPIECSYGKVRLWPSYLTKPYNRFRGNSQYQYLGFSLGHGEFDIDSQYFEDTETSNFAEVTTNFYDPDTPLTAILDNVVTSVEVGGIELLGPNESEYTGVSGPFTINEAGTEINGIEVDVVLPQGLYTLNSKSGEFEPLTITALFERREIDDMGDPVGSWTEHVTFTQTLATNTPQRFTLTAACAPGRYEFRGARTSDKDESSRAANLLRWDSLRGFLPSTRDYGAITTASVVAKATNNLNDRSAGRYNVIATRKLPIWDSMSETWSANTATRNPIWAFCDVFRAEYGARLTDVFLDMPTLSDFADDCTSEGINFDWTFDQRMTCWEAATTIARVFRARPILNGSQITIVREIEKTLPTAVFNLENIVKGSFSWNMKLANISEYDGVEVEYTDPTTYLPKTVLCKLDDENGDYPEYVKFPGCTDRDLAYRMGMHLQASRRKLRQNISFETGLEGHIPLFDDLIRVCHDLPRWGTGGFVVEIDGVNVTLSEPVAFPDGMATYRIAFSKKDGSVIGPFTVTAGASATQVVLDSELDPEDEDFYFDNVNQPPLFVFGESGEEGILCRVTDLQPVSNDKVSIECVVADNSIFDADGDTAPTEEEASFPPRPNGQTLGCSSVRVDRTPNEDTSYNISWQPVNGATSYIAEISYDEGTSWQPAGTSEVPFMQVYSPINDFEIRVAAINEGQGLWCEGNNPIEAPKVPGRPDTPIKFADLVQEEILFPVGSLSVENKTRSDTLTLKGFSEFSSPSTPPKKYLKRTFSGSSTENRHEFADSDCSDITVVYQRIMSGSYDWDIDTDSGIDNSSYEYLEDDVLQSSGSIYSITGNYTDLYNFSAASTSIQTTATTKTAVDTGACNNLGSGDYRQYIQSTQLTHEDENTELNQASAELTDWASIMTGGDGIARLQLRTTGFSYFVQECLMIISAEDVYPFWDYFIEITWGRRAYGSMGEFVAFQTDTFLAVADDEGDFEIEVGVPNAAGYETTALSTGYLM